MVAEPVAVSPEALPATAAAMVMAPARITNGLARWRRRAGDRLPGHAPARGGSLLWIGCGGHVLRACRPERRSHFGCGRISIGTHWVLRWLWRASVRRGRDVLVDAFWPNVRIVDERLVLEVVDIWPLRRIDGRPRRRDLSSRRRRLSVQRCPGTGQHASRSEQKNATIHDAVLQM